MTFKAPLEIDANTHIQYSDCRLIRVERMTEKVEYSSVRYKISRGGSVRIIYQRFYQVDLIPMFWELNTDDYRHSIGNSLQTLPSDHTEIYYVGRIIQIMQAFAPSNFASSSTRHQTHQLFIIKTRIIIRIRVGFARGFRFSKVINFGDMNK